MSELMPESSPLAGHEVLLDQLIECGQLFHSRGWSVGTSSNYSAVLNNDPVELIVTASGKDKGRLGRHDFVHIGADGNPIESDQPKSSAETMLHVVLAEQNDIGCILHTHSVWGTLLSDHFFEDGGFEIEGFEMLKGLEGIKTHEHNHWLPIFENTQDIPALAELVRERLSDPMEPMTHGFLIRKHGLYTWGKDVFAARRHIEIYEFLFECIARKNGFPLV
jgi:methylthioribulose-1-phosphate dehydratase